MLQLIGFIVGAYALVRLIQVPLERLDAARLANAVRPRNRDDDEKPLGLGTASGIILAVSLVGALMVASLMVQLATTQLPQMPRF